jgi:micrococcal nuclease
LGRACEAAIALTALLLAGSARGPPEAAAVHRIDTVADGDTVELAKGQRVRLVEVDTPEVYFHPECYGKQASAVTKRVLPPGTPVRLVASDRPC